MKLKQLAALISVGLVIAGCDSDDDATTPPPPPPPPAMATFDVTVSNLTNAQPLSPVAVIAHADGYSVFAVGTAATAGLEVLAEGGDNADLIAEADADANVLATASGASPIGPAGYRDHPVSGAGQLNLGRSAHVSASTMLVNTNDAITMLNGADVSALAAGESVSFRTIAYDAGTEANTEEAAHIPGPAGGGEGFNAARDDIADRVAMHPGVVSQDDGYATSDLTGQHRFDNAVAAVRIERIN